MCLIHSAPCLTQKRQLLSEWQIWLLFLPGLRERGREISQTQEGSHRNAPRARRPSSRVGFQNTREVCGVEPIPRAPGLVQRRQLCPGDAYGTPFLTSFLSSPHTGARQLHLLFCLCSASQRFLSTCETTPECWIPPSHFTGGETEAQEASAVSQEVSGKSSSRIHIPRSAPSDAF